LKIDEWRVRKGKIINCELISTALDASESKEPVIEGNSLSLSRSHDTAIINQTESRCVTKFTFTCSHFLPSLARTTPPTPRAFTYIPDMHLQATLGCFRALSFYFVDFLLSLCQFPVEVVNEMVVFRFSAGGGEL
jgi:hypothetical protein